MSTWEEVIVDIVNEVRLDPRNVRLDLADGVPESDIVQDLFTNEKALAEFVKANEASGCLGG